MTRAVAWAFKSDSPYFLQLKFTFIDDNFFWQMFLFLHRRFFLFWWWFNLCLVFYYQNDLYTKKLRFCCIYEWPKSVQTKPMLGTFLIYSIFKGIKQGVLLLVQDTAQSNTRKKALSYCPTECLDTVPENGTHTLGTYVNKYSLKNSVTVPVPE